jgi:hypothetical protein
MSERIENADQLEVFEGFERDDLEGKALAFAGETGIRQALDDAFGYRGDVTLELRDGSTVEGYVFDCRPGATLADSLVRLIPNNAAAHTPSKMNIPYDRIAGLRFSGRDTAAGKSWDAWVRKHAEKKAAGETGIALQPEALD